MDGYGYEAYDEQTRKATETDIVEAFTEEGERRGYKDVSCELTAFDELKLRWVRDGGRRWIKWFPSDMLVGVPMHVVEDIASTVYEKLDLAGDPSESRTYDDRTLEYLNSDEMCMHVQEVFVRRKELKTNVGGFGKYLEQASTACPGIPDHIVAKYGDRFGYSAIGRLVVIPRSLKGAPQNVKWAMFNKAVTEIARGVNGYRDPEDRLVGLVPVPVDLTEEEREELSRAGVDL